MSDKILTLLYYETEQEPQRIVFNRLSNIGFDNSWEKIEHMC